MVEYASDLETGSGLHAEAIGFMVAGGDSFMSSALWVWGQIGETACHVARSWSERTDLSQRGASGQPRQPHVEINFMITLYRISSLSSRRMELRDLTELGAECWRDCGQRQCSSRPQAWQRERQTA